MNQQILDRHIAMHDFDRAYWLKQQLIDFCRRHALPASGSKRELSQRIRTFLQTGKVLAPAPRRAPKGKMPAEFRRDTVIGSGWRCSQAIRAFFKSEIGPQFHFNATMREFIKHGEGKTLQEAIDAWYWDRQNPQAETPIAPQFEYNRHIRDFFQQLPDATLQDAIAAWNEKKAGRSELK